MKVSQWECCAMFALFLGLSASPTLWAQQYQMPRSVIGTGGEFRATRGDYTFTGTAGQTAAGISSGSGYQAYLGFWRPTFNPMTAVPHADVASRRVSRVYPNPFGASTTISFTLDQPAHAVLSLQDPMGRSVRMLIDRSINAGMHQVQWDGNSQSGDRLPSGTYWYVLEARSSDGATRVIDRNQIILVR
jgi:hypothetical protein